MGAQMHTWRVGRPRGTPGSGNRRLVRRGAGRSLLFQGFLFDSGLLAAAGVDVLVKLNRPLSRIIADIRKYENSGEINFRIARKQEAMDA